MPDIALAWFRFRVRIRCIRWYHTFMIRLPTLVMLLLNCFLIKIRVKCLRQMSIRYSISTDAALWPCITSCCRFVSGLVIISQQGVGSSGYIQKPCCQGPLSCSSIQRRDDSERERWTTSFLLKTANTVLTGAETNSWSTERATTTK